ncbi:hypothetical protein ACFVIM_06045 [Streptomyces sp. NPDC057638]|uniref:hypothetical protein n=1 Tax=Streptomyces sp. NPDC057638 TaxID=3346190 RepID=UPI0036BDA3E8
MTTSVASAVDVFPALASFALNTHLVPAPARRHRLSASHEVLAALFDALPAVLHARRPAGGTL